jgi:sarcosine oxidase subunit alpha
MSAGVNRLPAPAGLLLDRERPVSFRFEGESYRGLAGDTLASALAANGEWLLSRSFKYHRPRGVLTMAGQDANTLVQLKGEPNVLADRLAITEGLDVVMGLAGRFMPVGFYYRAFFKPRGIWEKFWEPIVRRKAGLGRVELDTPHGYFDKAYGFYDLAVIGGGPAGLAAALAAAEAGAEVLLVEENPLLGGSLTYARFDVEGGLAGAKRAELVAAVEAQANIEVMTGAVCNGWFADNWLPVIRGNRLYKVRAKEMILASGAIEQPAVFRNNDLPGVMQGSAAQRLINLYGVKPGTRAVVMTANAEGYGVTLDLLESGVEVAAVAELRHEPGPSELAKAVAAKGVPGDPGQAGRQGRQARALGHGGAGGTRRPGR